MTVVEPDKKSNKWLWIGLGGALVFCLCAVGVAVFLFARVGQKVKEGMKTDPVSAAKAAHEIADYELPPGYQEQMAMDLYIYSMVVIGSDTTNSSAIEIKPMIMLAQFQAGADPEQMKQQIRQSFEQQAGRRGFTMKIVETKTMTIRGAETDVLIYEGTDDNGDTMRQLITTFPGKDGTAMLMIMGSPQNWDQEEFDAFIESIH
jgi:hypothetical protein